MGHTRPPPVGCWALFTQLSSHCGLVAPLWGLTQAVRAKTPHRAGAAGAEAAAA